MNFMFNLCSFSSYVMPGEQRMKNCLTSLYNKGTVIDSFVETNDKIPGEALTHIFENLQLIIGILLFNNGTNLLGILNIQGLIPVVQCCTMLYNVHVHLEVWSRHQNVEGFL